MCTGSGRSGRVGVLLTQPEPQRALNPCYLISQVLEGTDSIIQIQEVPGPPHPICVAPLWIVLIEPPSPFLFARRERPFVLEEEWTFSCFMFSRLQTSLCQCICIIVFLLGLYNSHMVGARGGNTVKLKLCVS